MNARHLALSSAFAVVALAAPATADPTLNTQFSSNAEKACDFAPAPAVTLGAYDWHAGISTTVPSELAVKCNVGVVYSITSDRGLGGSSTQNYLAFGSTRLAYTLLVQPAGAPPFDPAASGSATQVASGNLDQFAIVLNVPAAQLVPVGAYTDVVTFTLDY
jgi:spore coat protein U-like protein